MSGDSAGGAKKELRPPACGTRRVVGLVGEVCAGKSSLAERFAARGAQVWHADAAVHGLYRQPEVAAEVQARFGTGVLAPDGSVDRAKLAALVFNDRAKLEALTQQVVFPRIRAAIETLLAGFRSGTAPLMLLDAPTLFEAGHASCCDTIVYVGAPLEQRVLWAAKRGWDRAELLRRDARLAAYPGKRERADVVLENAGTKEDWVRAIDALWARLTGA